MSESSSNESKPVEKPQITIDPSKLEGVKLSLKQKRALGLVTEEESAKVKARNEVLRQRMLRINEERKKARAEAAKAKEPEKPKKVKRPPPQPVEESSSSEDEYIQRKAKKVKKTLQALNGIEERLAKLRQSNPSNPFFELLCR